MDEEKDLPDISKVVFNPGTRVGSFRILKRVAVGGMGVVYQAMDEELGRLVALKHPRLDVPDSATVKARFLREARAVSRLLHPNVVPIFEVFESEGLPWMAMEWVEGIGLRERLKQPERMPIHELLQHAEDLAGALAEAHGLGVLHRDIKPANVILDSKGRARLIDFGLARRAESGDRRLEETITRLTERGFMVGTPGYMSPEQALGRSLDGRSDLFCLGLVIFEMCTGTPALGDVGSESWLDNLLHRPPTPVAGPRSDFPEELWQILNKALAKKPKDRYQSAAAMQAELGKLRRKVESGKTLTGLRRSRHRLRLFQILASAAIVAGLVMGTLWLREILVPEDPRSGWVAQPLTHDPAWAADPALSPDESLIAYASGRSGNGDIWLIDRDGGNPLQLTHDPAADRRPTWSPDGSLVYFTSFRSGEAAIWKVQRLGGAVDLVLADADDPGLSPDGRTMTFVRRNESGHYRVAIAPLNDLGNFRYLTNSEDGYWYHRNPTFSPDGRMIAYHSAKDLWVISLEGGRPKRLTFDEKPVGVAVWAGQSIVYSTYALGTWGLWRFEVHTGRRERLTDGSGGLSQVSSSADVDFMVASTDRVQTFVHIRDRLMGTDIQLSGVFNPDMAAVAPDGSAVVFVAGYRGGNSVFLQPLTGGRAAGEPRVLVAKPGSFSSPVFSPDGKWIAFARVINEQRDIWTLAVEGGALSRFTIDETPDLCPYFSPDGKYVAFSSGRSGRMHIWRARVEGGKRVGEPEQLTFGDTTDYLPRISPDGSMLAYLGNEDNEENVWLGVLNGRSVPRKLTHGRRISDIWWEPEGRSLLVSAKWTGVDLSLRRVSAIDGSITIVEPTVDFGGGDSGGIPFSGGAISLSIEGTTMAYTQTRWFGDLWTFSAEGGEDSVKDEPGQKE